MTLKLGDIPLIANSLKFGSTQSIKLLNKLIGFPTFDRTSRTNLRNFTGFASDFKAQQQKDTLFGELSLADLVSIATLLHIDTAAEKKDLLDNIFTALTDLNHFQHSLDTSFLDESDQTEISSLTHSPDGIPHNLDNLSASNITPSQSPHSKQLSAANNLERQSEIITPNDLVPMTSSSFPHRKEIVNTSLNYQNNNFDLMNTHFWIILRDLADSCRKFSGDDTFSIINFFNSIEENFYSFPHITDNQKTIFLKRLLIGSAKAFLSSQHNLNTYELLKAALIEEFSEKISAIDIHKQLSHRKLRNNETFTQYFLAMREIASRSQSLIDVPSIIQYTINGIPGDPSHKIVLYGANTFNEFKLKLRTYETLIKNTNSRASGFNNSSFRRPDDTHRRSSDFRSNSYTKEIKIPTSDFHNTTSRCFNCNASGHLSKFCPHRSRGPKCLTCKNFGHKSYECRRNIQTDSPASNTGINSVQTLSSPTNMCKDITILNCKLSGLVDTGSELTLIRRSAWLRLGNPTLRNNTKTLTGLGFARTQAIGSFESELKIDDQIFTTIIFVVPDSCMTYDLILGYDVISQATLTINADGATFSHPIKTQDPPETENFIMQISTDVPTLDIGPNISKRTRDEATNLLLNYKPNKIKTANIELNITLTDNTPVFHTPRRLPFAERGIVDAQIDEWLQKGIIEPCSSPYSSQIVVVKKKDGKHRICIDYRQLNRKLVKDHYPLPLIDDILDRLQTAKIFTTLDLRNGFFHVPVNENSRHYTSFVTNNSQFQFRFMPFGLSSCPSNFMRYINTVFRDLISQGIVLPYMDDLIIPANDESEALNRLRTVLAVARDYGLDINFNKCQFLHTKIEFLGHIVENGKLFPSPSKTKAVLNYPDLKNTKDVRRFLGLTGYFRKFIPSYSTIAKPLSDLLRKDTPFCFQTEQRDAFQKLKFLLSQKPVLNIFNQNSPIELHTDASIDGLGAVLLQKSMEDNSFHPVFYMSKKTSDDERKYTSFELEVLAVVQALKKFRIYLLGSKFKIITDCDAFVKTLNKKELNSRIARWTLYLQDFDYTIEHRKGIKMSHVDALSRNPCCFIIQDPILTQILKAQQKDENITTIKTLLETTPHDNYIVKNQLLYKTVDGTDLLVVPDDMQTSIIKAAHEHGHFAVVRTQRIIDKEYFIPHIKDKIEKYINNCVICILNNRKRGKQEGLLHPIEKDDSPLHTYHVDHLGPLATTSKRYKHIFAVIDAFTKFVWLYPTKSTDAAEVIKRLNLQSEIFGNPARIISDKGTAFTSTAFKDYCDANHIKHVTITTGLPRSNGQVERLNSTIISVLSKLTIENPDKWYSHVATVQQILNSTFHRSINSTPFELLFGTKMKSVNDLKLVDLINDEITATFISQRDDLRKDAKQQILKIQNENRHTYNLRRKPATKFALHDLVAIKRTQFGPGLKLKQKFLGPYKITKVKCNNTYDVEKCDFVEGPFKTSTCSEFMKPWSNNF